MQDTHGTKINPQIEAQINVLSSEYEIKQGARKGRAENLSPNDKGTKGISKETGRSITNSRTKAVFGQDVRRRQGNNFLEGKKENGESENVTLSGQGKYLEKDSAKSDQANQLIEKGAIGSCSGHYLFPVRGL